jgi:hypothetical protein
MMSRGAFVLALGFALVVGGPSLVTLTLAWLPYSIPPAQAAGGGLAVMLLGTFMAPFGAAALAYGAASKDRP